MPCTSRRPGTRVEPGTPQTTERHHSATPERPWRGSWLRVLALAVIATALAGCTPSTSPTLPTPPPRTQWDEVIRSATTVATARGASPEQLAVITSGRVTFDDYERAVRKMIACLESNGIEVIGKEVTRQNGYPEISYSVAVSSPGRTDQQTDEVSNRCMTLHSQFVEGLYRDSPEVQAAMDRAFEPKRAGVLDCLKKGGLNVPPSATRSDIEFYASDLVRRTGVLCRAA